MAEGTLTNASPDSGWIRGNLVDNSGWLTLFIGGKTGNFDSATVKVEVCYEDPDDSPTAFVLQDGGADVSFTANGYLNKQIKARAWRLVSTGGGASQSIPWKSIG